MAILVSAAVLLGGASCGHDCAGVGIVRVLPEETTIQVGESFTAIYEEGSTCTGFDPKDCDCHQVARHWQTPDTLIIVLDSLSGRVTGRARGDAQVTTTSPHGPISVLVHVR